jgi:hypothetical protein
VLNVTPGLLVGVVKDDVELDVLIPSVVTRCAQSSLHVLRRIAPPHGRQSKSPLKKREILSPGHRLFDR